MSNFLKPALFDSSVFSVPVTSVLSPEEISGIVSRFCERKISFGIFLEQSLQSGAVGLTLWREPPPGCQEFQGKSRRNHIIATNPPPAQKALLCCVEGRIVYINPKVVSLKSLMIL